LLMRFVRGKYQGMPRLDLSVTDGSDDDDISDSQLDECFRLISTWRIDKIVATRIMWDSVDTRSEDESIYKARKRVYQSRIKDISERFEITKRRAEQVIKMIKYLVIKDCVAPYTLTANRVDMDLIRDSSLM